MVRGKFSLVQISFPCTAPRLWWAVPEICRIPFGGKNMLRQGVTLPLGPVFFGWIRSALSFLLPLACWAGYCVGLSMRCCDRRFKLFLGCCSRICQPRCPPDPQCASSSDSTANCAGQLRALPVSILQSIGGFQIPAKPQSSIVASQPRRRLRGTCTLLSWNLVDGSRFRFRAAYPNERQNVTVAGCASD